MAENTIPDRFVFKDDRNAIFAVKKHQSGHYWLYIHHPGSNTFHSHRLITIEDIGFCLRNRLPADQEQKLLEKLQ